MILDSLSQYRESCCPSASISSICTARWMSPSGWWGRAAWDCATTSSIWRATAATTLSSCRSRRSLVPRMPRTWGRWGRRNTRVTASSKGSGRCSFCRTCCLGWTTINNRHYLVRQLNDHKASIEMEDLKGEGLMQYAEICGELLARGHARSGDAVALDGYIGTSDRFVEAIAGFAVDYADQTEQDYKTFLHSRFAPPTARKKRVPASAQAAQAEEKAHADDQGSGAKGLGISRARCPKRCVSRSPTRRKDRHLSAWFSSFDAVKNSGQYWVRSDTAGVLRLRATSRP